MWLEAGCLRESSSTTRLEETRNKDNVEREQIGCLALALRLPRAYVRNDPDDSNNCSIRAHWIMETKDTTSI